MRALILLAAIPLIACSNGDNDDTPGIPGTGSGRTRSYAVADFAKVSLRGSDDVDVRVGGAFSVRAEGDPDVLDKLRIVREGDTLVIRHDRRVSFGWGGKTAAKVFVTMPRIAAAALAGSGDIAIDRVDGSAFEANSAGSGSIAVAALAVDTAAFSMAGSGGIRAAGTVRTVRVSIAGSGDVAARDLKASEAKVSIAGSGSATMTVAGPAAVSIMGSGDVDLGSAARCTVSKMGSGSVRCGG